jgi:hypothetical protein
VARVEIAFELIHGEMARDSRSGGGRSGGDRLGGSRLGGRRDGSLDSNPWFTLSRRNATSVDFTYELIHGELAGGGQSVGRHVGS